MCSMRHGREGGGVRETAILSGFVFKVSLGLGFFLSAVTLFRV